MARSPLYDYYDPYGILAQQAQLGMLPAEEDEVDEYGMPVARRQPRLSDLMPEEQRSSMLRNLAETGMSGLQLAGTILDTPGAIVRGILAGRPLSAFSDERVSGRDLLRQYGLVGEEDNYVNFGAGLAAEMLTDPLTYLNPFAILGRGSLTRYVGEPLRKAGMLRDPGLDAARGFGGEVTRAVDTIGLPGDTVARLPGSTTAPRAPSGVREYLRNLTPERAFAEAAQWMTPDELRDARELFAAAGGRMDDAGGAAALMSFKVPGTSIQYDITGGAFGDALARGLDQAGEWSKRAPVLGPLTRGAAAAFDSSVGYTLDPDVQMAHRRAFAQSRRNEERLRREFGRLERDALGVQLPETITLGDADIPLPDRFRGGFASQDLQNALADWLESPGLRARDGALSIPGSPSMAKTSGDEVADYLLENIPEFRAVREAFASLPEEARQAASRRGLRLPEWVSRAADTQFFPRQTVWFGQEDLLPEQIARTPSAYTRGERLFGVTDNLGRSRQLYTDIPGGRQTFRAMTGGPAARQLQDDLLRANNQEAPGIIDAWFDAQGIERPYERLTRNADGAVTESGLEQANYLKVQLADFVRGLDRKYAEQGVGVFDTPVFTDALRYATGQGRVAAFGDELVSELGRAAQDIRAPLVEGGTSVPLARAAEDLGFDANLFAERWRNSGRGDIAQFSIDKRTLASLKALNQTTRLGLPESGALRGLDAFTKLFKTTALAWPSFHARNLYSNAVAMLAGESSPRALGQAYQASRGNLGPMAEFLANAPIYSRLTPAERMARFGEDAAAAGVGMGNVFDDLTAVPEQSFTRLTPGLSPENDIAAAASGLLPQANRTWRQYLRDLGTIRGVGINRPANETRNPLLRLNEAVGNTVEDTTRLSMFADLLRRGYSATQAGDMVRRALIDYSPSAYSSVEREFLKRLVPFYSFQKGMFPSIAENLLYRPGGVQGQAVRVVSRASEPTEENFVPERFRRSSAIPLPFSPREGVQRYLTRLDLPWEGTFNLLTPGVGASLLTAIGDTLQETASNLLGQTNPLLKAPLEFVTDRQLYSGTRLSDAYSVLENQGVPGGRGLEQVIMNFVPFGSRGLGLYRQLVDDRLAVPDRLAKAGINVFSGFGLTDIDSDAARERAARNMLQEMLADTPGVRTYENLTLDDAALERLSPAQRDTYLLYRIVQSEAARRAKRRDRQQEAMAVLAR
jgi:hypothetical protein